LSARKTPKLLEVKYIQKPVADLQEIHPSSDPTAAERRQHNQEEQPAARKQVFSPTLEIRSYQQVDRILISSEGGCWLNRVTNTYCNKTTAKLAKHPKSKRQCFRQKTPCVKLDITVVRH
jgi:hypothetical protein